MPAIKLVERCGLIESIASVAWARPASSHSVQSLRERQKGPERAGGGGGASRKAGTKSKGGGGGKRVEARQAIRGVGGRRAEAGGGTKGENAMRGRVAAEGVSERRSQQDVGTIRVGDERKVVVLSERGDESSRRMLGNIEHRPAVVNLQGVRRRRSIRHASSRASGDTLCKRVARTLSPSSFVTVAAEFMLWTTRGCGGGVKEGPTGGRLRSSKVLRKVEWCVATPSAHVNHKNIGPLGGAESRVEGLRGGELDHANIVRFD